MLTAPRKIGFDNEKYLALQTEAILERVRTSGNKLYLEFGGKLLFDMHASRVLPGFDPCVKMRLLHNLKDQADIILCIFAGDIERKKVRADFGITYDADAVKLIDDLHDRGVSVAAVVITRFEDQPAASIFRKKLERRGIRVFTHNVIPGYPTDVGHIVSDAGYGQNAYVETAKPLVVVTGPGPNSGKLSTCLSQLYHDYRRGVKAGYAKFETFPIWNLPLKHPVNVAYEAATADIRDFNLIDPHHLEAYGEIAVNYNRDVELFPVVKRILEKITGEKSVYCSPTDMGVNKAGFGITDDALVQAAAKQEVIRRYFRCACEYALGFCDHDTVRREELLLEELGIRPEDRPTVLPARTAAKQAGLTGKGNEGIYVGAALELPDGGIVTGKNSVLMHAASATVLNAIKSLAGIPDRMHLLAPNVIDAVGTFKRETFAAKNVSLSLDETLTALAISATTNPMAQEAVAQLKKLRCCEMHLTHLPTSGDEAGLRRLGVNLTSEPNFASKNLSD
ncbi:MAG: DUF1846 domain-containing protein [Anaerolineales bacterium]|nr:DUF1846 domain-containing protein [Anaerolineales bacterium]